MKLRKVVNILLSIGLLVFVAACGGGSDENDPTPDTNQPPADTVNPQDTGTPDTTTPPEQDTTRPEPDVVQPVPDVPLPPPGDGNDSFAQAVDLPMNSEAPTLEGLSPVGDTDYFTFEGTKGQLILIDTEAQNPPFDKNTVDLVITLYDSNEQQIGLNDDPFPRTTNDSTLVTVLPADGTYYVSVSECWTWAASKGLPDGSCASPQEKSVTDYALFLSSLDPAQDNIAADAETGNTAADATAVGYVKNQSGQYLLSVIYGTFADNLDLDVFAFQLPADATVSSGRSVGYFSIHPAGVESNGSTSPIGSAYITTADDTATTIAFIDASLGGSLDVPLPLDVPHLLFLQHPGGLAGANDFYVINHRSGGSNPLEADDANNGTSDNAEVLVGQNNDDGSTSYFIEGNIIDDGADVDVFMFDVPQAMADTVSVACGAQRSGSGLVAFKATLMDEQEASLSGGTATETAAKDLGISQALVPAGNQLLYMQVEAGSQNATITSNFYRCGIHFRAAQ
jgi:hypothetical protein